VGGYRLGFFARAASWAGLALGVVAGARLLPAVLPRVRDASEGTLVLVAVGLLVGTALIGQALGLVLGAQLHQELPPGAARRADQAAGGVVGVAGVAVALWLLLPLLAHGPTWVAEQARGSAIARHLDGACPDGPDTLAALRRLVGDDPFPEVFAGLQRAPDSGELPATSGVDREVAARVARSTVKVRGVACSRLQEGS